MGTFDGNLAAYHTLYTLNEIYLEGMNLRLSRATTKEEVKAITEEGDAYFDEQMKLYEELGKEMKRIMDVKWWQFWK